MKHFGELLKNQIESRNLVKKEVASAAGISYNYLSTIFKQESVDAKLLEKLCLATGLNPTAVFDIPAVTKNYSDINASTLVGSPSINIGDIQGLQSLLVEKERTIQILMRAAGMTETGTKSGHNQ